MHDNGPGWMYRNRWYLILPVVLIYALFWVVQATAKEHAIRTTQVHFVCKSKEGADDVARMIADIVPLASDLPPGCKWLGRGEEKIADVLKIYGPPHELPEGDFVYTGKVQRDGYAPEYSAGYLDATTS